MEILKKKLKKALALLNQIASNKYQLISGENYDIKELKNENILIQFKNKNNEEKEIHKAIILNLFFILRKKLNDRMNYSIHNETIKLKSLVAEEISKFENGNGLIGNKNSVYTFNNLNNVNNNNNNEFELDNIGKDNIKNIETLKMNKLCKNTFKFIKIIKEKFEIIPLFKENVNLFEKLELNSNEVMQDTSLIEFNNILEKINKSYKVDSIISIYNAFNLFIDGKKSEILIDKNNYRNSENIEQCLNKLKYMMMLKLMRI
jgi:nicotinic acid mononucleotide adenylyltransferase